VTCESHRFVNVAESFRPKVSPRFSPQKHQHIPIAIRAEYVVEEIILGQEFLQAPEVFSRQQSLLYYSISIYHYQ